MSKLPIRGLEPLGQSSYKHCNVSYLGSGAEGRSRTGTELPPPVFETGASTIPPLRLAGMALLGAARHWTERRLVPQQSAAEEGTRRVPARRSQARIWLVGTLAPNAIISRVKWLPAVGVATPLIPAGY